MKEKTFYSIFLPVLVIAVNPPVVNVHFLAAAFVSSPLWLSRDPRRERCLVPLLLHAPGTATATATAATTSSLSRRLWGTKPQRLEENTEGVLYVNDRCINCAACSGFAPEIFERSSSGVQLYHVVHKQPESGDEFSRARAAMAACPVAAIRIETLAERRHLATTAQDKAAVQDAWTDRDEWTVQQMSFQKTGRRPFPRPFLQPREGMNNVTDNSIIRNVYWTGHHNEASFGAIPYLVRAFHHHDNNNNNRNNTNNTNSQSSVWIMVDTPKFSKAAVEDVMTVTGPTGPDYLFLTHVDDTADHGKWAARFSNNMKRIFHSSDLGRHNWIGDASLETVEILLPATDVHRDNEKTTAQADGTLTAYNLDGTVLGNDWLDQWENGSLDVVILHTPGHSPGSISLLKRRVVSDNSDSSCPGILFTGDTYAYTTANGGRMTGFGRYGHNRKQQVETLSRILNISKHWDVIAPGHGHARDYRGQDDDGDGDSTKAAEIKVAQDDLIPGLANRRV